MAHKKIAVLAGDGIGEEVMHETIRVLNTVAEHFNHRFTFLEGKIGGAAYDVYGTHCPHETLQLCDEADAILFGSVGGSVSEQHLPKWKNCEANSILKLRQHFGFNINIRPIVKNSINCVIFRELNGGLYFGRHESFEKNNERVAVDECVYSESHIASIAHQAFKTAETRKKKVCSVDKANVLATSKLWRTVMNEISNEYPDVELTHMLVDNCAMQLVLNPEQFDVVITENMFGDILSDLGAALTGSLGLIPSASLNADGFGLYEPAGGSAPDIAGLGIANPCAQIFSAAMMLRYSFGMDHEARFIEHAVQAVLSKGIVTKDLAGNKGDFVGTREFVDQVILNLASE